MTDNDNFEKVSYTVLEPEQLTWYEWLFGKNEPEIEADKHSRDAKYKVTEQIKQSINHKLIRKHHQSDIPFPHTQSIVKTEDKTNDLPSPYQPPILAPKVVNPNTILNTMANIKPAIPPKKLHPSIQQLKKRKKGIKDDLDI